jgi:hypothetical protein
MEDLTLRIGHGLMWYVGMLFEEAGVSTNADPTSRFTDYLM